MRSGNPVANPELAGTYTVTAAISSGNYTGSTTGTLVIARAAINANGVIANNKTYDGTTAATISAGSATLSGVLAGDKVTLNAGRGQGHIRQQKRCANKLVTVSGLTLTGADAGNYSLIQPTTTAKITAATLTVTGITAATKVYDDKTTATLSTAGASLAGKVAVDVVTLVTSGGGTAPLTPRAPARARPSRSRT